MPIPKVLSYPVDLLVFLSATGSSQVSVVMHSMCSLVGRRTCMAEFTYGHAAGSSHTPSAAVPHSTSLFSHPLDAPSAQQAARPCCSVRHPAQPASSLGISYGCTARSAGGPSQAEAAQLRSRPHGHEGQVLGVWGQVGQLPGCDLGQRVSVSEHESESAAE